MGGEKSYDEALKYSNNVKDLLVNLGFLIAYDKCHWHPCQKLDWLDYAWDFRICVMFVKKERIRKVENQVKYLLEQVSSRKVFISARYLASIVGNSFLCTPI